MTSWHREHLAESQSALLDTWLPDAQLGADLSWDLALTTVLDVSAGAGRFIVKAGSGDNHHVSREIAAHRTATGVLADTGHASRMVHCDNEANILVTTYLPGQLVQGTSAEADPDTYLQAGRLLGRFHRQHVRIDDAVDARATCKALAWLDGEHRIDHGTATLLRETLRSHLPVSVPVVPTHGDWQPRNWLFNANDQDRPGTVRIIDFGRFEHRPAMSDFCRLAAQQWQDNPELEAAFFDGYGADPRDRELWRIIQIREAIGTAAWAYKIGDETFERQGHRMIAAALALP